MAVLKWRLLQPGERVRVMVVDDSVVIRRLVTQALEEDPMLEAVGTASNGAIGLQRIPQFNPDVIILDIEMPDMNGLEMLRRMRREYRKRSRINNPGRSAIGEGMISRSVRSVGRIIFRETASSDYRYLN
jgi:CheY-like chemotaxis protein